MGITTQWDNPEHTIIRYIYNGSWSVEDFHQALRESREMLDTVDHRIGLIIDLQNSKLVPNGVLAHGSVSIRKHRNQGKSVIVGAGSFVHALFDIFKKIYRRGFDVGEYDFASSLEDARNALTEQTLPSSESHEVA